MNGSAIGLGLGVIPFLVLTKYVRFKLITWELGKETQGMLWEFHVQTTQATKRKCRRSPNFCFSILPSRVMWFESTTLVIYVRLCPIWIIRTLSFVVKLGIHEAARIYVAHSDKVTLELTLCRQSHIDYCELGYHKRCFIAGFSL